MKNRSAANAQRTLTYFKPWRKIAGTVTATILFGRLEFWFDKYENGFYKFLEPAPNRKEYRRGDSWVEELAFSKDEFRTAFDAIGIRYTSGTAYESAARKFIKKVSGKKGLVLEAEALYCSVLDREKSLTFYYRNHQFVDRLLDEINTRPCRQSRDDHVGMSDMPDRDVRDDHVGDPDILLINTHEDNCITQLRQHQPTQAEEVVVVVEKLSEFSLEQFLAYAISPNGKGIELPYLWAERAVATGEKDDLLRAWLDAHSKSDTAPPVLPACSSCNVQTTTACDSDPLICPLAEAKVSEVISL